MPVSRVTAQDQLPQVVIREGSKTKKDTGPRALGLLRLSNGKATLIPVAILINGKFYDASAYKADPVPMALDAGTVYEAERSGDSLGLFTINGVMHSRDANSQNPWIAKGSYLPNGSVASTVGRKAETVPRGLDADSGPPRLTRGEEAKPASGGSSSSAPTAGTSDKAGSSSPASTPASSTPGGTGGNAPTPTNAPAATPAGQSAPQTSPPTAKDQSSGKESASSSDDSYRPVLRRGKPTQPLPDDDYAEPTAASSKPSSDKAPPAPAPVSVAELIPAVSDAAGPEPRSYKFDWRKGEEGDRQQQMLDLAKAEFQTYLQRQAKATVAEEPTSAKKTGAPRKTAKPPEPELENVQFKAFDVWSNNEPVMVFSAEAHMPAGWKSEAATQPENYFILLVARTDIYSNLHKLYVGITDKYHLDLTPRLELIDVVDADGDGRGELLFRETTDAGTGYVIYRATADTLWKMYDSSNPE